MPALFSKPTVYSGNLIFLFVLLLEGAALMAVELIGAKLAAPFFGSSLYVWTAVLGITVLGLTGGYYLGGILSLRKWIEKELILILLLAGILVFFMPTIFRSIASGTSGMDIRIGIILCCFLYLLPPMVCFGTVGPMVVRVLSVRMEHIGKVAGTVYFTSTFGGIIATFLFSFYFIPYLGLSISCMVTAIGLVLAPLLILLHSFRKKNEPLGTGSPELQIDKNIEKTTKTKTKATSSITSIKARVYLFAILEGATVMAIELIAARMLAPYFGSSLMVWGTVIGVTLFSLALGYYFGGIIADRFTHLNSLYWTMLVSSLFLMLMQLITRNLTFSIGEVGGVASVLIISLILLLPPLLLLGMVPSLLIKLLSKEVGISGKVTGRVYTLSSASGIVSLLIMGFFVIPRYGLAAPSLAFGLVVGIIPFYRLIGKKKYIALLFPAILIISMSAIKQKKSNSQTMVKYFSEGLLGQILVADIHQMGIGQNAYKVNDRILFVNRMGQTFIDLKTGQSKWHYINYATAVMSKLPENSEALLLGLGGGTVANMMQNGLHFKVDAVELDKRIVDVAKKYFSLNPATNILIDDARHYLATTQKKYDLIFFDVFKGEIPPAHVLSKECFDRTGSLLKTGGFIIVNFNGFLTGNIGKAGRSIYKTLLECGFDVEVLPTYGTEDTRNMLFIASPNPLDFTTVRFPLKKNNVEMEIPSLFISGDTLDLSNVSVFLDDKPNLELLNMEAAKIWREGYTKQYTTLLVGQGVPLFE